MDFIEGVIDKCSGKGNSHKPPLRSDGTVVKVEEMPAEKKTVMVVRKKNPERKPPVCPFKKLWTTTIDIREGIEGGARTVGVAKDGTIYVASEYNLMAIGYDGQRKWRVKVHPDETPKEGSEADGIGKINKKPLVDPVDGTIYIAAGTYQSRLHAISPAGDRKWMAPRHFKDWMDGQDQADSFQYGGQICFDPYVGYIYVPGLYGLSAFSRDGHQVWCDTRRSGHFDYGHLSTPVVATNGVVVVAGPCENEDVMPRMAYGLQAKTGDLLWSTILENSSSRVGYYPTMAKRNMDVYVACGGVVRCISAATGSIRWATDLSGPEFGNTVFNIVIGSGDEVIVAGFRVCALDHRTGFLMAQSRPTGGDQITLDKARDVVYGGRGTPLVPFFALSLKALRGGGMSDTWQFLYIDENLDLFPPAVNPFVMGPFGMSLFTVTNLAPASIMCLGQP